MGGQKLSSTLDTALGGQERTRPASIIRFCFWFLGMGPLWMSMFYANAVFQQRILVSTSLFPVSQEADHISISSL